MEVFLLAAGHGTRVEPLSKLLPKPLFPILNMPAIEYQIRYFSSYGIKKFTINTHHLANIVESKIKNLGLKGVKIRFSREEKILGTGGGIKKMLTFTKEKTIIVSNTDAIYNFDFNKILKAHKKSECLITLILIPTKREDYSKVFANRDDLIKNFHIRSHKISRGEKLGFFSGIHIIEKDAVPPLPDKDTFCIIEDYYSPLVKAGFKINSCFPKGIWLDTGEIPKYFDTNIYMLRNQNKFKIISQNLKANYREIKKNTFLHKKTKLPPDISLKAPLLIGEKVRLSKNLRLGPNLIVGDSTIIGEKTAAARNSLFMDGSVINKSKNIKKRIFLGKLSVPIKN